RSSLRGLARFAIPRLPLVSLGLGAAALVIWAGYRFSFGVVDNTGFSLPAPEFFSGVSDAIAHNREGHNNYLFGKYEQFVLLYVFPVALSVKTPVPFLFLTFGAAVAAARHRTAARWPLACAVGMLLVGDTKPYQHRHTACSRCLHWPSHWGGEF